MGLGQTLGEDLRYDGRGRLLNADLESYRIPTSEDIPPELEARQPLDATLDDQDLADEESSDRPDCLLGDPRTGRSPPGLYDGNVTLVGG